MRRRELNPWWLVVVVAAVIAGGFIDGSTAQGQEPVPCLRVPIEHDTRGPHVAAQPYWMGGDAGSEVRYALVGHYVWFQWGHADNPGANDEGVYEDTLSFDVADETIVAALGCVDGSVELVYEAPEVPEAPETTTTTLPDVEPMATWCEDYGEILPIYCELPNRVLSMLIRMISVLSGVMGL